MVIRNESIAPTRREKALGIVRSLPNPRIARKLNRGGGDLSTSMRTVRRTDLGPRKGRLWVTDCRNACCGSAGDRAVAEPLLNNLTGPFERVEAPRSEEMARRVKPGISRVRLDEAGGDLNRVESAFEDVAEPLHASGVVRKDQAERPLATRRAAQTWYLAPGNSAPPFRRHALVTKPLD